MNNMATDLFQGELFLHKRTIILQFYIYSEIKNIPQRAKMRTIVSGLGITLVEVIQMILLSTLSRIVKSSALFSCACTKQDANNKIKRAGKFSVAIFFSAI